MPANKDTKLTFPKDFLWGASISTHQVEGGNQNQWTTWELETAQVKVAQAQYRYQNLSQWSEIKAEVQRPENYVSGRAADHFRKYGHDFDLAKRLHLNTLRTGIEWSRIEPNEGEFNEAAVEHYRKYFTELKKRNITPVLTLWHWSMPNWFAEKGGFLKRRNIKYFTRYVQYIIEQLDIKFQYIITINEPTVYAGMSYHEGRWPPENESKIMMIRVILNLLKAHRKSYKIIKKLQPETNIGLAHHCMYYYPGDDSQLSKLSAWVAHKVANEFAISRVKKTQDFLGVNYYSAYRILGTRAHNVESNPKNDLDWDMQPDKIYPLLSQLYRKYQIPTLITESGLADRKDIHRQWWIVESIKALNLALKNNIAVAGYIHWSLLDNFEWAEGFWPRFGLIEVNYDTQQRKPRPSALWYGRCIKAIEGQGTHGNHRN